MQTIEKEIRESNILLDDIDKACGNKCKKIMLGGNHEARYAHFMANNGFTLSIRRMKQFTSWQNEYNLMGRGWISKDYGEYIQIGKIVFTHGFFTGPNAAKRMSECYPGRNLMFGHTHNHLVYNCLDERDQPISSESIGTLSRFDLSYLKGKPPITWINMFEYVDMNDDGTFSKHPVYIINGQFIEFGKTFGV